jgi:hypothetical protein
MKFPGSCPKNWNTCAAIPQIGSPCCTQNIENAAFRGVNSRRVPARRRIVTRYGSYCVAMRKAHRHECLCYQERLARSMERSFHYEKGETGLVFIDSAEQWEGKSQKLRILVTPKGSATRKRMRDSSSLRSVGMTCLELALNGDEILRSAMLPLQKISVRISEKRALAATPAMGNAQGG